MIDESAEDGYTDTVLDLDRGHGTRSPGLHILRLVPSPSHGPSLGLPLRVTILTQKTRIRSPPPLIHRLSYPSNVLVGIDCPTDRGGNARHLESEYVKSVFRNAHGMVF
jgi:hypothetical protein